MYGLIGSMKASPGERENVIAHMLAGTGDMPGCLSYVVARDPEDDNGIWVTEVWTGEASHKASMKLPAVQAAIAAAMPLIESFGTYTTTDVVGGFGLSTGG